MNTGSDRTWAPHALFFNLFFSSLLFFFSFSSLLRVLSRIFNLFSSIHTPVAYTCFYPFLDISPLGSSFFFLFPFLAKIMSLGHHIKKKNHISSIIVVVVFSRNHFDWFCVVHLFFACEEKPCDHVVFFLPHILLFVLFSILCVVCCR